jgi:hypothetical protein
MFAVGSPKAVALSKVAQKKNSPKPRAKKNRGGSSKGKCSSYMVMIVKYA